MLCPSMQAVENVSSVMANILRTSGKLEQTTKKLLAIKTEESTELFNCKWVMFQTSWRLYFYMCYGQA